MRKATNKDLRSIEKLLDEDFTSYESCHRLYILLKDIEPEYYQETEVYTEDDILSRPAIKKKAVSIFSRKENKFLPVTELSEQDARDTIQQIWNSMNIKING